MTAFDGHKGIWMWQFSQQAEKTLPDACTTARDLAGADVLMVKAMDGLDWMALYDPGGYGSLAQFQADAAAAAASGVTVIPWVVPHGQNPQAEAAAHARLGPVVMVDLEPYAGFWTGPAANMPVYLAALRNAGVRELHLSIDPRPSAIAALNLPAPWSSSCDGLHPQVYWTDFEQPALTVIPMIRALLGDVPVYPILPGNGTAQDLADIWSLSEAAGCPGVSVWRLGSMDIAQLQAFKEIAMVTPPTPDPSLDDRVTNLEASVAALNGAVGRLNDVLIKRFEAVRVALDPANPPA